MKLINTNWAFLLICVLLLSTGVKAEDIQNSNVELENHKRNNTNSIVMFKIAEAAYKDLQFDVAAKEYEKYIDENNITDFNILLKLADCHWQMRNYSKALEAYKSILPENCDNSIKLRISELYARNNNYKLASQWLQKVNGFNIKAEGYKNIKTIAAMKKDSLNWKIGYASLNTEFREFSPFIKNNTLFFSSNRPKNETKANGWDGNSYTFLEEVSTLIAYNTISANTTYKDDKNVSSKKIESPNDIYECGANPITYRNYRNLLHDKIHKNTVDNSVGKIIKVEKNPKYNFATFSMDKENNAYFSSNYNKTDKKGVNRICIMEGKYSNLMGISDLKKLPFGNQELYSVMHPTVNNDGTLLIFSSDKDTGSGGFDLYFSERASSTDPWGEIHLFGKNINTQGNEVFPTITDDGYLFFSSDGMQGLGGLDMYYIPIDNALKDIGWAEHISYPINSAADDFGWAQEDNGRKGFFTSDRNNDNDNIYSFTYSGDKLKKTNKLVYGYVIDNVTAQPLNDATVFMYSKGDKEVTIAKTDANGKYQFPVDKTGRMSIKVAAKSYLSDCILVQIDNLTNTKNDKNPPQNIIVKSAKVGEIIWKSSDINYDFNRSEIRSDAAKVLNELTLFLKKNDVTIEISSHTDSRGSDEYNKALSQKRAEAVVSYLINQGINRFRIVAKGYGETQLINKCSDDIECTEAEHQANRRTEVRVTGISDNKDYLKFDIYKLKDKDKVNVDLFPKDFFEYCK